jgi:hypothetical protein
MKKQNNNKPADDIWGVEETKPTIESTDEHLEEKVKPAKPIGVNAQEYDLEGLMTDFPTAKELERFVYDETGVVLNLKGRANKLKYQIAMDVLNGVEVDEKFVGNENPYIERAELIPTDPIMDPPARSTSLPPRTQQQNAFYSPTIPHPDEESRMMGKKVHGVFRKYMNGMISYEILGPLEQRPFGEKLDKFGRTRPEVIKWVDPRTGEQVLMREDGTLTPIGKRLRATLQTMKVNKSTAWDVWVDREFVSLNDDAAHNPWDLSK